MSTVIAGAILMTATSCLKEENIQPMSTTNTTNVVQARGEQEINDPQLPLNEELKPLINDTELYQLVLSSSDGLEIEAQGGYLSKAQILSFGDPNKFIVFVPQDCTQTPPFIPNSPSKINGWAISIYSGSITGTHSFSVTPDPNYIQGTPFSGKMQISDLSGNMLIEVGLENGKPVWTPHGGHATWTDCFEANSSTWWGIIGYVVAPVPTLIGIAVGCL